MEQESRLFHQKVRDGYLELARSASDRFVVVDAGGPLQDVIEEARTALVDALTG
jgi:dTMP kinase